MSVAAMLVIVGAGATACSSSEDSPEALVEDEGVTAEGSAALEARRRPRPQDPAEDPVVAHGRDLWFNETFGGGWFLTTFLSTLAPEDRRIRLGFDLALAVPRSERFAKYGLVNDPDCRAPRPGDTIDPAHPNDVCKDPRSTGILGLKLEHDYNLRTGEPDPSTPRQFGVACASCHAGFDPVRPPRNPAEPKWENIHPTIGALRFRFGEIFGGHFDASDPRQAPKKALFSSWNPGTVDTTTLFDDGVNNPGVVTAFWNVPDRPYFTNAVGTFHRSGQGGEDDVGGATAAARVYSNVGMCFRECSLPAVQRGVPIDVAACKRTCAKWPKDSDLSDIVSFLDTAKAPKNPMAKNPRHPVVKRGKEVFEATCAGCHSGPVQSSDEMLRLGGAADGTESGPTEIGTNDCRAQTTNWDEGKIWAQFASPELNTRGYKGYRIMPLTGMWATAPYLHHNAVGSIDLSTVSVRQSNRDFEASAWELLTPPSQRSGERVKVTTVLTPNGPQPVPINVLPSLSGGRACEVDELKGHAFGTTLCDGDKRALIEYLRTL